MGKSDRYSRQNGILTANEWAEIAKSGEKPDRSAPVRHMLGIEDVQKTEGDSRELVFTISTDSIDRQGDRIHQDGWDFGPYLKNPVVLWGHNYRELPVGRALRLWVEGNKAKARVEFAPEAVNPMAERVYQAYKSGFMSAVSVGFIPREWKWAEGPDRQYGIDFLKQELLEFSAVTVPANAEALLEARGLDGGTAVRVTPDAYAVTFRRRLSTDDVKRISEDFSARLPGVRLLILDDGAQIEPIYSTETPEIKAAAAAAEIQQRRARIDALRR